MEKRFDNTPIGCSLTTRELLDREAKLLAEFRSGIIETDGTSGGLCLSSSVSWQVDCAYSGIDRGRARMLPLLSILGGCPYEGVLENGPMPVLYGASST